MSLQLIDMGTAPSGIGGDTKRSAFSKINTMFTEIYKDGLVEKGSNAKGEYTKYPDGTLLTWGKQILNDSVLAGQGRTWNPGNANQPYPFVGAPVSEVNFAMMTAVNGGGNPIYCSTQQYYQNGDLVQVGVNMGTQPALAHPSFVYGTTTASSYIVFFSCVGRWK